MMMRLCVMIGLLASAVAGLAQNPEVGRIDRRGDRAVLVVEGPRPVDSAALTLAKEFGVAISVEDPLFVSAGNFRVEIPFALNATGTPSDLPGLVRDLITAANSRLPFAYRIDAEGARLTLVPTGTKEMPLLDRRVTIPAGTRSVAASAGLMAEALAAQTGMRVSCCQAFVAGIPWGLQETSFGADNESARSVLRRLIVAASPQHADHTFWLQRCDPKPPGWCFLNLMYANQAAVAPETPPIRTSSPDRWFQKTPEKP
jgi:hypothetical protein